MRLQNVRQGLWKRLALAAVAGMAIPATSIALAAAAPAPVDVSAQAGIAQSDQSFNTLVFDYNGDGVQDVLYSPQNDKTGRQLWRGNPDGTFTLVTHLKGTLTSDQHGCATADFDHNGLPDVYCALGAVYGSRTKANPLWLQQPDGSWTLDETSGAQDMYGRSYSATVIDANGDGWPDLFVDNYYPRPDGVPTPDRLFINLGDDANGTWLGFADAGASSGLEIQQGNRGCDFTTDVNNDGIPDIVFCGAVGLQIYEGHGDGTFTDASSALLGTTSWFTADAKLIDLNGDGWKDLVFIRNGQEGVRYFDPKSGTFKAGTLLHTLTFGRSLEIADVNGDGVPDIYALEGNGQPGCTTCLTNYPDYLYLGSYSKTGAYQSGTAGTFTLNTPGQGGSGDTVNAIRMPNGQNDLIVGNGANLISGPLQLWQWASSSRR